MYEVIVLGATFAAAGIAETYGKDCLVIEQRMDAGYEFFCAHFDSGPEVYPYLQKADVRFGSHIVSVEKTQVGFVCTTHGVEGFCTFEAKRIIDTRVTPQMCESKAFPILIASEEPPAFAGVSCKRIGETNHYIVSIPVSLSSGYPEARSAALDVVKQFSQTQKLIYSADQFDYRVKDGYPKEENGILYLPSKAFDSPGRAFQAGKEAAR